jgi:gas vesicle protein
MSPPSDDVEQLRGFCSQLEATNHTLEAAATNLEARAKSLAQAHSDLNDALAALKTDGDGLEKDVETLGPESVKAAERLDAETHQALDSRIPAIRSSVGEATDHSHQTLTHHAAALESAFAALQSSAFEPLETVLTSRQSDFEHWGYPLSALLEGVEGAQEEFTRDTKQANDDLTAAGQESEQDAQNLRAEINTSIDKLSNGVPNDFMEHADASATAFWAQIDAWTDATTTLFHDSVHKAVKDAVGPIQEENQRAPDAIELVRQELGLADGAFKHLSDSSWEAVVQSLVNLAPKIDTAEGEVQEIRATMEQMRTP